MSSDSRGGGTGGRRLPSTRITCFEQFSGHLSSALSAPLPLSALEYAGPSGSDQYDDETIKKASALFEAADIKYV